MVRKTFTFQYLIAILTAAIAFEITWIFAPFLTVSTPLLAFLAAVMITAWYGGFGPALVSMAISALLIDYYFIEPVHSLVVAGPSDLGVLGLFAVEAVLVAALFEQLKRAQRGSISTHRELERLQQLSARLVDKTNLDSMLEEVLKSTIELLGGEKGVIQLYDSRKHALRLIKQIGFGAEFLTRFEWMPIGSYSCGTAFERKQRIIIENVAVDPEFTNLVHLFKEFGVVGAQSTPLFTPDGVAFGVFSTYWARPYRPSESDLNLLDLYAHQAERILIFKQNEETLRQANEALERNMTDQQSLLKDRDAKLRNLMAELILTEERERRQLSVELHDSLAQLLVFARMKLRLVQQCLPRSPQNAERYVRETDLVLERSLDYTRTLMAELNPPDFEELGLPAALRWLAGRMLDHGLMVNLQINGEPFALPHERVILIYQCVRELLVNVIKHARVHEATMCLTIPSAAMLHITVQDEGPGFDPSLVAQGNEGEHFGLNSIRSRLEKIGGQLIIESGHGRGCTVTILIPLDVPNAASPYDLRAAMTGPQDRVIKREPDHNQETLPFST